MAYSGKDVLAHFSLIFFEQMALFISNEQKIRLKWFLRGVAPFSGRLLLTRHHNLLYSEPQASPLSRRLPQVWLLPWQGREGRCLSLLTDWLLRADRTSRVRGLRCRNLL